MKTQSLFIHVEAMGIVNRASIEVNGITLLTGQENTGKQDLMNFITGILDDILSYEANALEEPIADMEYIGYDLKKIIETFPWKKTNHIMERFTQGYEQKSQTAWIIFLDHLETAYYEDNSPDTKEDMTGRIGLYEVLEAIHPGVTPETITFPRLIRMLRKHLDKIFKSAALTIAERPLDYLLKYYSEGMPIGETKLPARYQVTEGDKIILSNQQSTVGIPTIITQLESSQFDPSYEQKEIFPRPEDILQDEKNPHALLYPDIIEMLRKIMRGKIVSIPREVPALKKYVYDSFYYREDGEKFKNPFSHIGLPFTIEKMLREGKLTSNTLLTLEYPENNWGSESIAAIADLITLVHRRTGTHFMVCTSINEVRETFETSLAKAGLTDSLKIYESHESETPYRYNYTRIK